ncbi:unnamed protein product [Ophioblennius macclurei]
MAASVLRLGRLTPVKCLRLHSLGVLSSRPAALFSSEPGEPVKAAKKTKAAATKVAAVAPPEPEEPFDNSTYKNYQHHTYNPYTFADLDLEMAKFRLPQPSSGRPSPRH